MLHTILSDVILKRKVGLTPTHSDQKPTTNLTPNNKTTYVVGDIHGCNYQLCQLLSYVVNQEGFNKDDAQFIFIGDYVDRGPHSKDVIDTLIFFQRGFPDTIFLRGNHDDMFLAHLAAIDYRRHFGFAFYQNGGYSTIKSYKEAGYFPNEGVHEEAADMPKDHLKFLLDTQLFFDTDEILFVHAGVNVDKDLEYNTFNDFLWVGDCREYFFGRSEANPWHKNLIHGHTVIAKEDIFSVYESENRINIDTGAAKMGLGMEGDWSITCLEISPTGEMKTHHSS